MEGFISCFRWEIWALLNSFSHDPCRRVFLLLTRNITQENGYVSPTARVDESVVIWAPASLLVML